MAPRSHQRLRELTPALVPMFLFAALFAVRGDVSWWPAGVLGVVLAGLSALIVTQSWAEDRAKAAARRQQVAADRAEWAERAARWVPPGVEELQRLDAVLAEIEQAGARYVASDTRALAAEQVIARVTEDLDEDPNRFTSASVLGALTSSDYGSAFVNVAEVGTTLEGDPPERLLAAIVDLTEGDITFERLENATATFRVGAETLTIDLVPELWWRKRADPTAVIAALDAKARRVHGKGFRQLDELGGNSESILLAYGTERELVAITSLLRM